MKGVGLSDKFFPQRHSANIRSYQYNYLFLQHSEFSTPWFLQREDLVVEISFH